MKIYFIYNKKLDMILESGKGRRYSGYIHRYTAESILKQNTHKSDGLVWQLLPGEKMSWELSKTPVEDWEIKEMELK